MRWHMPAMRRMRGAGPVLKSYGRGVEWHCMTHTEDFNGCRGNEPDFDSLLVTTIESTVGKA
jgi:hypothetical protein